MKSELSGCEISPGDHLESRRAVRPLITIARTGFRLRSAVMQRRGRWRKERLCKKLSRSRSCAGYPTTISENCEFHEPTSIFYAFLKATQVPESTVYPTPCGRIQTTRLFDNSKRTITERLCGNGSSLYMPSKIRSRVDPSKLHRHTMSSQEGSQTR
jgi:hypothetical protein